MTRLTGSVTSGKGDFARWISLLHEHYLRKTGLSLFPGTLNVRLSQPYSLPDGAMKLEAAEYGGRVSVFIVPCRIFDRPAVILRTESNELGTGSHPREIIEIATDVKLRDAYRLADGDIVTVEIADDAARAGLVDVATPGVPVYRNAQAMPSIIGVSGDLKVRVLTDADADALYRAIDANRDRLRPWFDFVDGVTSVSDSAAFVQRVQKNLRESGKFWAGIWEGGRFRGAIGLANLDRQRRSAEFGIWLTSDGGGRGLAHRAASLLINFLFDVYGLSEVTAECAAANVRSGRLMERLGLPQSVAHTPAARVDEGSKVGTVYSISASEWRAGQSAAMRSDGGA